MSAYIYIYIHTHIYTHAYIHIYIYINRCTLLILHHMWGYIYIYIHTSIYIHIIVFELYSLFPSIQYKPKDINYIPRNIILSLTSIIYHIAFHMQKMSIIQIRYYEYRII